jgi:hypothetical protein
MLTVTPPKFRAHRGRRLPPPPPAALTLVAAAYDFALHWIDLTFDRAVNIAAMDVTQITIDDSDSGNRYRGSGTPTLTAPATVRVETTFVETVSVPNTFLTAGPANGIIAANDGGRWAGVTDQVVPFS